MVLTGGRGFESDKASMFSFLFSARFAFRQTRSVSEVGNARRRIVRDRVSGRKQVSNGSFVHSFALESCVFVPHSISNQIVALKEIRLNEEEGTPFTAIREGSERAVGGSPFDNPVHSVPSQGTASREYRHTPRHHTHEKQPDVRFRIRGTCSGFIFLPIWGRESKRRLLPRKDTDLSKYMEHHLGGIHPHNVKLFLFQLIRGLAYCHARRILHRCGWVG